MQRKTASSLVLGLSAALLAIPALAAGINARVKAIDPAAHTFTVIEGGKDYTFAVTDATKFVNGAGALLSGGLKTDGFKAGTRLSISYETQNGTAVASEVKLRDKK